MEVWNVFTASFLAVLPLYAIFVNESVTVVDESKVNSMPSYPSIWSITLLLNSATTEVFYIIVVYEVLFELNDFTRKELTRCNRVQIKGHSEFLHGT